VFYINTVHSKFGVVWKKEGIVTCITYNTVLVLRIRDGIMQVDGLSHDNVCELIEFSCIM